MGARWPRSKAKNIGRTPTDSAGSGGQEGQQPQSVKGTEANVAAVGLPGLRAFAYGEKAVRVVEKDGEVWFVAQDVCDVLGIANSRDATNKLDEDERGVGFTDTSEGRRKVVILSEGGALYLILRSRKPGARALRRWVTDVVLPSILRTGKYIEPGAEGAASPHITLPGPGLYSAHMTKAGQVTCLPASEAEAATRIYFAEGRLMARQLQSIRDHWSIVQEKRLIEEAPRPLLGAEDLNRAITEGDRLATEFMPLWDISAQVKK